MRITLLGLVVLLLLPLTLFAAPAEVPQTGQRTSYASGDDGDLKTGAIWPTPRFTANKNGSNQLDGTVTDNLTGLIWLKHANCSGTLTWANAITWSNDLATGNCGLNDGSAAGDWRLPNVTELESLVNASQANSATWLNLPAQGFNNVQSLYYWSSSTYASNTGVAWYVNMDDGGVFYSDKTGSIFVWPVRGGQ